MYKLGFYKPRGEWDHQTLVHTDDEVFRMWQEGIEFGFIKIYIECKSGESSGNEMGEDNGGYTVDVHEDQQDSKVGVHYEAPIEVAIKDAHNAPDTSDEDTEEDEDFDIDTIGGDDPESDDNWVNECEIDDEFLLAQNNKRVFKSTIVDNDERLGVDSDLREDEGHLSEYIESDEESFDTPCSSAEIDLLGTQKKKKKSLWFIIDAVTTLQLISKLACFLRMPNSLRNVSSNMEFSMGSILARRGCVKNVSKGCA